LTIVINTKRPLVAIACRDRLSRSQQAIIIVFLHNSTISVPTRDSTAAFHTAHEHFNNRSNNDNTTIVLATTQQQQQQYFNSDDITKLPNTTTFVPATNQTASQQRNNERPIDATTFVPASSNEPNSVLVTQPRASQ
jgi:hypothetical protein